MATIRKRGNKWQAQVRRSGRKAMSRSFIKKADAQAWARQVEIAIERRDVGRAQDQLRDVTLADLLRRYMAEVTAKKRGRVVEETVLRALIRAPISSRKLCDLNARHIAEYRDLRLGKVKPVTVARELGLMRHCMDIAKREWELPLEENPVDSVRRPNGFGRRERRLKDGELDQLVKAATGCRNPFIAPLIRFATETGMRQGELLRARWKDVDVKGRTLRIPEAKNGHPRTIPLTANGFRVLLDMQPTDREFIFPTSASALKQAWRRLVRRVGIEDLRFHDLRHEAVSRFFDYGLTVPEVAQISGHRDHRMLFRYAHARPSEIGRKLALSAAKTDDQPYRPQLPESHRWLTLKAAMAVNVTPACPGPIVVDEQVYQRQIASAFKQKYGVRPPASIYKLARAAFQNRLSPKRFVDLIADGRHPRPRARSNVGIKPSRTAFCWRTIICRGISKTRSAPSSITTTATVTTRA